MGKTCTQCGDLKDLSEFGRFIRAKDGLRSACLACSRARTKAAYIRKRDGEMAPSVATPCRRCGETFPKSRTNYRKVYCGTRCKALDAEDRRAATAAAKSLPRLCPCGNASLHRVGKPVCDHCRVDPRIYRTSYEWGRKLERYGLTQAEWDRRVAQQGNRCALCRTDTPDNKRGSWHIDHDHSCCAGTFSCGKCVRGLLCHLCNVMLGNGRDDADLLRAAADYIERHRLTGT
jgi:hypothetical protein